MTFKGVPQLKLVNEKSPVCHEIAPYLRLPVDFYTPINVMWINIFVFQMPDVLGFR